MDYCTLSNEKSQAREHLEEHYQSLYKLCQEIPDGRRARGQRYELAALLVLLLLAKLAGETSLLGASEWLAHRAELLQARLAVNWKRMPCANTYRYALAHLCSEQVNAKLAAWLVRQEAESRCGQEPSRLHWQAEDRSPHLAIDGKALRGSGTQSYGGEEPQQHILHIYEVQTGIVLAQCPIESHNNEISALKPLLTDVLCKGRIITADAAQSYHAFPRLVKRAGGEVILTIKENTPQTRADLALFFEDPEAQKATWRSFEQRQKGHGRLECRQIWTSQDLNGYLYREWGEIGQVFRLQRERTQKGHRSIQVVYGLTTLSPAQCSPQRLLAFLRAHWSIENRLHWRRDVTLNEDHCTVRLPAVAHLLAVLNSLVLALMDAHQISNVARQLRRFAAFPHEALAWLL